MRLPFVMFLLSGLLLATTAPGATLSGEELDQRVREISDGLRCPTCQSISVNDSEASFSRQIRAKVRRMLQEGQDEEAIRAFFVSRYGEWILRAPKKQGLGLVLWLLPGLSILLFGGWIFLKVRQSAGEHRATVAKQAEQAEPFTEVQRRQIEADRQRFEEED